MDTILLVSQVEPYMPRYVSQVLKPKAVVREDWLGIAKSHTVTVTGTGTAASPVPVTVKTPE